MDSLNQVKHVNKTHIRWLLVLYDLLIYGAVCLLLFLPSNHEGLSFAGVYFQVVICGVLVFGARLLAKVYHQIWRYGGIQSYIRMMIADGVAFVLYYFIQLTVLTERLPFITCLALVSLNLLGALGARMIYRYTYKCGDRNTWVGRFLIGLFEFLGATEFRSDEKRSSRIKVAIIGGGRTGNALADELFSSSLSMYQPVLFIDRNQKKTGREIHGIPVVSEAEISSEKLRAYEIQAVILAIPRLDAEQKKDIFEKYQGFGYQVKVYDRPFTDGAGKRSVREIDVEELLFRSPVAIRSAKARSYYRGKKILITGGGGSIGSEMCRQLAALSPEQLIILDVYENGAYDVQQELRIKYQDRLKVNIEIASITDKPALERVFGEYRPDIVVMAAAHKHVPLMEKNCIEAVNNNVFGTLNTVEVSEAFGVDRVILVSTDKAVNPTNVMGATKRLCEMIVQAHGVDAKGTTFSMTRFGNVLGSAGSVIPLFKKQIANGGPVTLTDKRIIRYFMTIPEASRLVLLSGAMANNGELFVLDMGQPVKILELAENLIRLSGAEDIEIVETGLRPGEKLFEELLMDSENLQKTENELIYIEKDEPVSRKELDRGLLRLKMACEKKTDAEVKAILQEIVPTYLPSV